MKVIRFFFRALGGTIKWTLMVLVLLIVIGIVAAVVSTGKSGHSTTKPVAVAGRVAGVFVRTGCLGCGDLTPKIRTGNTYCGWSGSHVIVHVTMRNTSAETVTVHWHPSYAIVNGAPHGTGFSSVQDTRLDPGATRSVFVEQSPKGVAPGSAIARCYPSFQEVSSG